MPQLELGVVCGLFSEANCLQRLPDRRALLVRCSGARVGAAQALSEGLIAEGVAGLVSFGTAGGLAQGLPPGTLVLGTGVVQNDGARTDCDGAWGDRLRQRLRGHIPLVSGRVAGVAEPLLTAGAKAKLAAQSGAVAVDMESGGVAEAAIRGGVPFIIVRAVADPSERTIPAWVPALVTPDGHTPTGPALAGLVRRPHHLPRLARLAWDSRSALSTLRRAALLACPLFQFDR